MISISVQISGWTFDNLSITIRRRLCEALYAAGHAQEAGEAVLETVNTLGNEVYTSEGLTKWLSGEFMPCPSVPSHPKLYVGFTRQCLATPETGDDTASKAAQNDKQLTLHSLIGSLVPSPLLCEWARASLMCDHWKGALIAAVGVSTYFVLISLPRLTSVGFEFTVPRSIVYRTICERLETIDRIFDASESFFQMMNELGAQPSSHCEEAEWAVGKRS